MDAKAVAPIRVLYVARYRHLTSEQKIALLARTRDLHLCLLRPSVWQDEYGKRQLPLAVSGGYRTLAVPLVGPPSDPHRAFYRTLTLGLRSFRPAIIHAEEEPDSLAAFQVALARRLLAPRSRLILHTWQNIVRPRKWYVRRVAGIALASADAVLCANAEGLDVLDRMGYAGLKAAIPPQGVDLDVFHPPAEPRPAWAFTVAYVGRFVEEKGLALLIEAFGRLGPPAQLLLIGGGPLRPTLQGLMARLGLGGRGRIVDPQPPEKLSALLRSADVLVLPSRTTPVWKEQFGRVLVEAMACEVPVVGSDSGAIPEVVGDAGLIFPEGDVEALAACLRRLMTSRDLRDELARRGLSRVRALYSQEAIAAQTAAFYRRIVSG